jgi:hypothetical protein
MLTEAVVHGSGEVSFAQGSHVTSDGREFHGK